tara:strand:+ start:321 stop:545 length:225 start_codon:yes stop_codon:yes gene_type:complete
MKEQLVQALKTKYEADYQMHKANLDIYLNNPVGIGEHPQHFEEMDKLVESMTAARDKLEVLNKEYPDIIVRLTE